LKTLKDVVWTGGGSFDYMGLLTESGTYTMLCSTHKMIVYFEVVQANETSGSQQTELEK